MLWAFAREGGVPLSRYIGKVSTSNPNCSHNSILCINDMFPKVDRRTSLPLYAISVTTVTNLLLALINIGSSVGFGAFISLIVASYYSSFILAALVMLNKRLRTPDVQIPWGPFKLGRWGVSDHSFGNRILCHRRIFLNVANAGEPQRPGDELLRFGFWRRHDFQHTFLACLRSEALQRSSVGVLISVPRLYCYSSVGAAISLYIIHFDSSASGS